MKVKLFVLCVSFVILCGCSGKGELSPILRGISFEADISYYNEKYVCDTIIDKDGNLTMNFKYPQDISDLKIFFNDGKAKIEYMGLTYTPDDRMPAGSVAQTLYDIISDVEKTDSTPIKDSENCMLDGRYNNTYFKFYFSPSGLPLSVLIPDDSFEIQFNNLTIINN